MKSILTFIGRESGFGESNNSAYVEIDNDFWLIDCGCTVFWDLKNNFDFNKYNQINVIITHLHNDHAGSLSQFIMYIWYIYHKKVNVYSKCEKIDDLLTITGTVKEGYLLFRSNDNIEFIPTEHVDNLDCYGFRLNVNDSNIVYTGDTKNLSSFLPYLDNCDEFYVEVSRYGGVHLKFDEVFDKLKEIKSKNTKVFLMHIDDKEYIEKLNNNEFFMD